MFRAYNDIKCLVCHIDYRRTDDRKMPAEVGVRLTSTQAAVDYINVLDRPFPGTKKPHVPKRHCRARVIGVECVDAGVCRSCVKDIVGPRVRDCTCGT